jgi:hypothetical protein
VCSDKFKNISDWVFQKICSTNPNLWPVNFDYRFYPKLFTWEHSECFLSSFSQYAVELVGNSSYKCLYWWPGWIKLPIIFSILDIFVWPNHLMSIKHPALNNSLGTRQNSWKQLLQFFPKIKDDLYNGHVRNWTIKIYDSTYLI